MSAWRVESVVVKSITINLASFLFFENFDFLKEKKREGESERAYGRSSQHT